MNRGDAKVIGFNICINGSPIERDYPDDIEFVINSDDVVRKTLSSSAIYWDAANERFETYLSQQDTFKLDVGKNRWQLRLIKDNIVVSTLIGVILIGEVISDEVL